MNIVLNGDPHSAPEGATVLTLLASLALEPTRVAVELNGQIVKRALWAETLIEPGAKIEIVQFVGGG